MSTNQPNSLAKENLEESFENEIPDIIKSRHLNIRDLEAKYSKILGDESAKDRTSDESTSESLTMDDEIDSLWKRISLDLESLEKKMTTKAALRRKPTPKPKCARPPQNRYPSAGYNFSRRPRTPPSIPPPTPVAALRISSLEISDSENNKS